MFRPRCSYSRGRRRRRRLRGRCEHIECGRPRRARDGPLLRGQSRGRCAPVFRSEVEHPSFRPVGREAQHAFEISLGAQVMKFARRNERSKYRVPAEAFWSLEALPVVQPQDETAQLALAHVIVNAKSTVFEKATELFALIVGTGDRSAQRTARDPDACTAGNSPDRRARESSRASAPDYERRTRPPRAARARAPRAQCRRGGRTTVAGRCECWRRIPW